MSGLSPNDFWDATLDEVILKYKAKIDELNFFRNGFYLIHCTMSEKPGDKMALMPLPFDGEGETAEDLEAEYNRLKKSGERLSE